MVADELRRQADEFIDLAELQGEIARGTDFDRGARHGHNHENENEDDDDFEYDESGADFEDYDSEEGGADHAVGNV
jgi:hypothetical protein